MWFGILGSMPPRDEIGIVEVADARKWVLLGTMLLHRSFWSTASTTRVSAMPPRDAPHHQQTVTNPAIRMKKA
jgi:hypothetical protein